MDLGHAANYFNTLPLDRWDHTLVGDPWITSNQPYGRLFVSDRDQTFSVQPRWRTLLVDKALTAKAIRAGGLRGQVYLVGNVDSDVDEVSTYSFSYPVFRAEWLVTLYSLERSQTVASDRLAQTQTRNPINATRYPCGIDRSGSRSSSLFDEVTYSEMTMVLPGITELRLDTSNEIGTDLGMYSVREAYFANGFLVVKALRKR